jgi:archaellum biogenesis protein FlaJ (TadC family)
MDSLKFLKYVLVVLLLFAAFFAVNIFYIVTQEDLLWNSLKSETNSTDAIIKSPAIIIRINTLTEFKTLATQLNTQVYYSVWSFYLVPDSYKGYIWTPNYNFYIWPSTPEILNR